MTGQEEHYEVERLQIVEMECSCDKCGLSPSELN